ncbi:uncharacterized protein H6S33_003100 [Morchella sextelata]|uniref:uncharacterized protein n=1 Tax=Morchella sextelata TaxID=1174677 RepID=UPI001D05A5B3|nr:uncharacterized protein H6S33_003100 [Morchella sextelata]KAH0607112.1 hypothetical protein H6S33_003100 [Morchella sextelata]
MTSDLIIANGVYIRTEYYGHGKIHNCAQKKNKFSDESSEVIIPSQKEILFNGRARGKPNLRYMSSRRVLYAPSMSPREKRIGYNTFLRTDTHTTSSQRHKAVYRRAGSPSISRAMIPKTPRRRGSIYSSHSGQGDEGSITDTFLYIWHHDKGSNKLNELDITE